ncbi:MAG: hypothetical protein ACRDY7_00835 [Acidimicrobiia bacterium]
MRIPRPAGPEPTPEHRLVVLGDSISHGFKSFAISDTDLSWPAIVARYGGLGGFRHPAYPGPARCPGLPLNLEAAIRALGRRRPAGWEGIRMLWDLRRLMDEVEDYWERGVGADLVERARKSPANHALASWGWDVRDVMGRDVRSLSAGVSGAAHGRDNLFKQLPQAAGERSALLTLSGYEDGDDTAVSLARRLGRSAAPGIETLVVAVGSNNILGTVLNFDVRWTSEGADADHRDLEAKKAFNAWTPAHFAAEYDLLLAQVATIPARHVIFVTVPHVTIAPMLRGVGQKEEGHTYWACYSRPWISDEAFRPGRDACMTGEALRVLDFTVDCYNDHIVERVRAARMHQGLDWRVLDVSGILDRLAYRRYVADPRARPEWWTPYPLPDAYQRLDPPPDTRFLSSGRSGRTQGGLFSLDGVHPTTAGYGILAGEVMRVMTDGGVALAAPSPNFDELVKADTLVSDTPAHLDQLMGAAAAGNRLLNRWQRLRRQPLI